MSSLSSMLPKTVGAKGSDVYSTTGQPLVDLNVKCVRGADPVALKKDLEAVLAIGTPQSIEDAFVQAFLVRNVRGGKGERKIFEQLFEHLCEVQPQIAKAVLDLIPHYGCWDDFSRLLTSAVAPAFRRDVVALYAKQLGDDASSTDGMSLAAKWAPREDKNRRFAQDMAQVLFPHVKQYSTQMRLYRQFVADLNGRLKTVETFMCAGRYDEIDPKTVPGRAGKIYSKAFLNLPSTYRSKKADEDEDEDAVPAMYRHPEDKKRMDCRTKFQEHYAKAAKGEAKVHGADTLFPHEVVKKVAHSVVRGSWDAPTSALSEDEKNHLRGVWRGMVEKAKAGGGLRRSLFMIDRSGSMQSSNVGDTPFWVSTAIGLLGAEACAEEYKDMVLTFDSDPSIFRFRPGSDLFERVKTLEESRVGQGTSTDFQKAMDLVLQMLETKGCRPGDEPENLIVLTDMGWDQACSANQQSLYTGNRYARAVKTAPWQTQITMIQNAFQALGERMWGPGQGFTAPRIVIWNLADTYSSDHHAAADTPGVAMLSGWSATQFEILQKEGPRQMTPYEMLRLELDDLKYQRVRDRIRAVLASL